MTLKQSLGFTPTPSQVEALRRLARFVAPANAHDAFVLSGCAGTGKTSIVKALLAALEAKEIPYRLAAPTARAAKVLAAKTGATARTLHSLIYTPEPLDNGPGVRLKLRVNHLREPALYIVDEASMVGDRQAANGFFISGAPLLHDFIRFVKEGHPRSKLLFIGDPFQLPPVGEHRSPALDAAYLRQQHDLAVEEAVLEEVRRQQADSHILIVAGALRAAIADDAERLSPRLPMLHDAHAAVKRYVDAYDGQCLDRAAIIAFTNRDVDWLNQQTRQQLGHDAAPLHPGDLVMLENTWMGTGQWLYRGETGWVRWIDDKVHRFADLHFIEALLEFPGEGQVQGFVLLEALYVPNGQLPLEQEKRLFHEAMKRNSIFRRSKSAADDPYVGAMRLRHAFALTGHKAQGGEWDEVLLHPYFAPNNPRWLYTALTRAREHLFTWPSAPYFPNR
jgi:exodeoxyribonuclease-5